MARRLTRRVDQQAVVAAIARREWMLQMLALAAAGCWSGRDRAYARGNTLIVGGDFVERPLTPDEDAPELVFLSLVKLRDKADRQPCLATSWEHSADYREWTYRLRRDVRWHDGRPVTVDDVAFTIGLHSHPDSPVHRLGAECTVHDASTFTVRGIGWTRSEGEADCYLSILPKHLLQGLDYRKFKEWDFWLRPVGSGPYRYLRHDPRMMVELEANPDYFKGKPTIARVVLKFTGQAGLTELLSGNVDAIQMRNTAQLPAVVSDARFQTYWQQSLFRSWAILWQNEHPLFRDRNVRRALSLAINRRELLQVLNLPSRLSRVDGVYTERQLRRGEGVEPRYDPAEARRLLDEAGWRQPGGGGVRERDGREFRFTALTLSESSVTEMALYVQGQLRSLGVRMDLQPLEQGVLRSRLDARKFEAMVWFPGYIPLRSFYGGEGSATGYRNPQLTRLIEMAASTADPDAVDQAYREMSEILRSDQPVAFLCGLADPFIVHRRVKGLSAPWRANPLLFTEDLSLENEATR